MVILGLTGSIGMGKSTTARMLRRRGLLVHDADRTVHRLLGPGGAAVAAVAGALGADLLRDFNCNRGNCDRGSIDRGRLGAKVFADPAALRLLETILHPLVREAERQFLASAARRRARVVVLDVPLLFETGGDARVDATLVVTAPYFIQRARVLARPGMTPDRLAYILKHQMPDRIKRRRADFVVMTGLGHAHVLRRLAGIVSVMGQQRSRNWPPQFRYQPGTTHHA
ncbi:MAG: dephospho-CoA kinase [Rhodospirillaceae bacterium]